MANTHATKPPGPFGTLQRLYVILPASKATPADLEGTPLTYSGYRPDGSLVALYERRTMNPDDDETIVFELSILFYQSLGLDSGWKVDWARTDLLRINERSRRPSHGAHVPGDRP